MLVPLVAVLALAAFGGGYLLARSPDESALPEDVTSTRPTLASTTTTLQPGLTTETVDWTALPLPGPAPTGVARIDVTGDEISDVAADGGGNVWTVSAAGTTRWNPADGSHLTFGEDVFGYDAPRGVAAAADGRAWFATADELFRYDGEWSRFRDPNSDEFLVDIDVTPYGDLVVLAAGGNGDSARIYRTGFSGDLEPSSVWRWRPTETCGWSAGWREGRSGG